MKPPKYSYLTFTMTDGRYGYAIYRDNELLFTGGNETTRKDAAKIARQNVRNMRAKDARNKKD